MQADATEKVWHAFWVSFARKPLQILDLGRARALRGPGPRNPFICKGLRQELSEKPPNQNHGQREQRQHGKKYPVTNRLVAHQFHLWLSSF